MNAGSIRYHVKQNAKAKVRPWQVVATGKTVREVVSTFKTEEAAKAEAQRQNEFQANFDAKFDHLYA